VACDSKHQVVELTDAERALGSSGEHLVLEQEAAVDVDHDLVRPGEIDVEHRQALSAVESLQCALDDQRRAEDARRLGERHWQAALEVRSLGKCRVVVGVAEFVGQCLC
jgi:hypothetical protein